MKELSEESVDAYLKKVNKAFQENNYLQLRDLSNDILKKSILTQDPELLNLSLIAYALYKTASKDNLRRKNEWQEFQDIQSEPTKHIRPLEVIFQ